jgi:hypothetical protein
VIGYTLPAKVYDENGDVTQVTVLFDLDGDDADLPCNVRLKDGAGTEYIVECAVADLLAVARALDCDRGREKAEREPEPAF